MGVLIIAEAGVNHNGSLELAKKLAEQAQFAGADYVKYQTFQPVNMVSKFAEKADYQKKTTDAGQSQLEMLNKLMLTFEEFVELQAYCEQIGIGFLSTAFDLDSIYFLEKLGCEIWKIPSGEVTNYPYLVEIAKKHQPIILSTGMCRLEEIEETVSVLEENGAGEITLLHCTTEYPTPFTDVNLKAMCAMKEHFHRAVGYSDHTKGIEVPIAAAAMGATVIEKHFTLDRTMEGPDHKASLEPDELKQMVDSIRNIELALGTGVKEPAESEKKNIEVARKSIVANRAIKAGEILTEENITTKRPGNGISPMRWKEVLGTIAGKDFEEDEFIELC